MKETLQGPQHYHQGDSRTLGWHLHIVFHGNTVTIGPQQNLHTDFQNVPRMEMFISSRSTGANHAVVECRPVLGWPTGLTCHYTLPNTHSHTHTFQVTPDPAISHQGWPHPACSSLIGSLSWLLWQQNISSSEVVVLTNQNMSVCLTAGAHTE